MSQSNSKRKNKVARKRQLKAIDKGMSFIRGNERQRYKGRSKKNVKELGGAQRAQKALRSKKGGKEHGKSR